ncbi:DUF5712 family protein [Flagellimonas sp. C4]|uniref:DUF5712 family protein n=1 Tax=Flagellimonas alginolytica TaxID=3177515 RepID=UPI0035C905F3
MVIKVHNPKHSVGKNTGSVANLVDYLEKENAGMKVHEMEEFFNHDGDFHTAAEVEKAIDGNKGKLANNETKFYMITVNPSKQELEHLAMQNDRIPKFERVWIGRSMYTTCGG